MKICRTWEEVNLRQFVELSKLKTSDSIEYYVKVLSILTGKSTDEIESYDINELKYYLKKIKFVDYLPESTLVPTQVDINGKRYNVILRVDLLKGGQYIDLKTFTKDEQSVIDNMHHIISIFLQPMKKRLWWYIPEKYNGERQAEIAQDVLNYMSVADAYPMAVFFWNLLQNLIDATHEYISEKAMKEAKSLKQQAVKIRKRKRIKNIGAGLSS